MAAPSRRPASAAARSSSGARRPARRRARPAPGDQLARRAEPEAAEIPEPLDRPLARVQDPTAVGVKRQHAKTGVLRVEIAREEIEEEPGARRRGAGEKRRADDRRPGKPPLRQARHRVGHVDGAADTCSCCRSSRPSEELPSWTLTRRRPAALASTSRAHGSMKSRCVPWAGGM